MKKKITMVDALNRIDSLEMELGDTIGKLNTESYGLRQMTMKFENLSEVNGSTTVRLADLQNVHVVLDLNCVRVRLLIRQALIANEGSRGVPENSDFKESKEVLLGRALQILDNRVVHVG